MTGVTLILHTESVSSPLSKEVAMMFFVFTVALAVVVLVKAQKQEAVFAVAEWEAL